MYNDWSGVGDERSRVANEAWRICRSQTPSIRRMIVVVACRRGLFRLGRFGGRHVGVVRSHGDADSNMGRVGWDESVARSDEVVEC